MAENNGEYGRLSFYNMLAHIVYKNRMAEENVAVKNIWEKNNTVFLDLYFYRTKKSQVIDGAFIHDLLDLTTEKYYGSAEEFISDFWSIRRLEENVSTTAAERSGSGVRYLDEIRDDLVILTFMAKCNMNFTEIKTKTICDYINASKPETAVLSSQYVSSYLRDLNPDEDSFYQAIENLQAKTPEQAENIFREAVKISASDGAVHYNERIYLAELLQALREYGLDVDVEI